MRHLTLLSLLLPAGASAQNPPSALETHAVVAGPDYCVARRRSGEEGAPQYWYSVDCKSGAPATSKSKWCWTSSKACEDKVQANVDELMRPKGYERVKGFKFSGDWLYEIVYRKPDGTPAKDVCLAHRARAARSTKADYSVDCGEGFVNKIERIDEGSATGTAAIEKIMGEKGFALVETFDFKRDSYFPALLFQKK